MALHAHAKEGERAHFLSRGPGAAAGAMSEAFTALADDTTAIYYNPAGLAYQRGTVHAEHTPVYEGGRYNFIGFHTPSRVGSLGFAVLQFATDDIETRAQIGDAPGSAKASQTAWFLPYAFGWKSLSLGAAFKKIEGNLAGAKASGYGLDAGALYPFRFNDWGLLSEPEVRIGLSVRNLIEPSWTFRADKERLPREKRVGLAVSGNLLSGYSQARNEMVYDRLTLSLDAVEPLGDRPDLSAGFEYGFRELLSLRVGYGRDLTFGMGYGKPNAPFSIDYTLIQTALASQHRFSFSYFFTEPKARPSLSPKLRQYKRVQQDAQRYRDQFLAQGRDLLNERRYAEAAAQFEKALVLDPGNREIEAYGTRAREADRLQRIRALLDTARREPLAEHAAEAVDAVIQATAIMPENRDVIGALASIAGALREAGPTEAAFLEARRQGEIKRIHDAYHLHLSSGDVREARLRVKQAQLLSPQHIVTEHMVSDLKTAERTLFNRHMEEANAALAAREYQSAHHFFTKAREIDPENKDLKKQLASFQASYKHRFKHYDALYQEQIYRVAALHFVKDERDESARQLAELLARNPAHEEGNVLLEHLDKESKQDRVTERSRR